MDMSENLIRMKPAGMDAGEWSVRLELAACYRAFDWLGWTELIYNHITARVPGPDRHYLINPYGLWYNEVTASNLVKINVVGDVLDGSTYPVNRAGFIIHSSIHEARADAHFIIHTHSTAGSAVSCKKDGLRYDNFYSALLHGKVAYHDFEGITTDPSEQSRLVASLGAKSVLILRNHGLLVVEPDVSTAFSTYWTLQRACEIQAATDAMSGDNLPVRQSVLDQTQARTRVMRNEGKPQASAFEGVLRRAGIRFEDLA
ncbi:MAG: class II aldolase/adducin family protein [Betaproteobacteria bacterium]